MATVSVRDVCDETLTILKVRAARAGQSLQAYVNKLLEDEAAALTPLRRQPFKPGASPLVPQRPVTMC